MVDIARDRRLVLLRQLPRLLLHPDHPFVMRNRIDYRHRIQRQKCRQLRPQPVEIAVLDLYDPLSRINIRYVPLNGHLMVVFIRFIIELHHRMDRLLLQRAETMRIILF